MKWSCFSVNRWYLLNTDSSSGGAFVRAAAVDRAYVWERKREVGVAIIDFQGGHADALSNKPHKGLFTRPLTRRA